MPTAPQSLDMLERQIGSADWSRWSKNRFMFYDYVHLPPAGTNSMDFYTVPNGGTDPYVSTVKTLEDTNMNESRSFGRVNYVINQIRTHIKIVPKCRQADSVAALTDLMFNGYGPLANMLKNLSNQGTLVINIGQKEYFDINQPFITCPPGFGPRIIQHAAATGNSTTHALWFQQDPDIDSVYNIKPEQLIESGQTFNVKIVFDHANSPAIPLSVASGTPAFRVKIGVIFDGYVIRPVQ